MSHATTFGAGSVTWKITSEAAITLGGARAVLMQIAHPLVAAGVSAHSSYMTDPYGRAMSTFLLGQMITFGSSDMARQAARTINRLHTHVYGTLSTKAGAFEHGTTYKAHDPELLLWVHATLIDTILLVYPLVIGHLTYNEQEQYYQESKGMARMFGLREKDMPQTVSDLRHYVDDMVHSSRLAATPQARQLAHQVLFPPAPTITRPLMHLHLAATIALLPQPIRDIYGLEWSEQQQRLFDRSMRGMKAVIPRLPLSLRVFPITRRLMQGS
ncbi:MAG: DUF2236 domain-containing protein [Chloroflexota bacterium]|nr:DUF2236 domain-containing protein [Chloroflexota bacterium]